MMRTPSFELESSRRRRVFARRRVTGALARLGVKIGATVCAIVCVACGTPHLDSTPALTDNNRELYARTNLEHARALVAQGRLEHAESRARRGLGFQPDNADLHRLHADVLARLGRTDDAARARARADELAPPTPLLPSGALTEFSSSSPTVLLLPPSPELTRRVSTAARIPQVWPGGREAEVLSERVRRRLPSARVMLIDAREHPAETIASATAFLSTEAPNGAISVQVERAYCGSSIKDGSFAVAWLRIAATGARAGNSPAEPGAHLVRATVSHPPPDGCSDVAIARALEDALVLDEVVAVLAASRAAPPGEEPSGAAPPKPAPLKPAASGGSQARYSAAAARSLFPVLAWHVGEEIDRGRRYLALGELGLAQQHFERAVEIDPGDPMAVGFCDEVNNSLALARQVAPENPTSSLDPHLSDSQRTGLEAQLSYERDRREEMLSALAVLYETRNAPTPGTVANMRPVEIRDPSATGIALAVPRVPHGTAVGIRTLLAPDGTVLARYYFADDNTTPVLREDDTTGDGDADRWVGYEDGLIREVWESDGRGQRPNLHIVYTRGGSAIELIEFDHNGNGDIDRVFVYASGLLQDEKWDTNGDGAFDRFQRFDERGSLTMREEDVDGDAEIDVRTAYNNGRIVRREILNTELLSQLQ